ncbi:MAG: O-antigen polymerase [Bryobacterales bacterium]|nr:O-antigen polymerase [Bryobacterales bacterium]
MIRHRIQTVLDNAKPAVVDSATPPKGCRDENHPAIAMTSNPDVRVTSRAHAFQPNAAQIYPTAIVYGRSHGPSFAVGAVVMFFLFSHASEFIDITGRLHLVLIVASVGFLALIAAGTIPKILVSPPARYLTLLTGWLIFSLPFSSWRGGSFSNLAGIWLKSYIVFFLVAGLIFTIEQCRKSIFWLAIATASVIYYTFRSGVNNAGDDRLSLTYGTLGNSNDLAGSLLMGVPFLVYVVMDKRRNPFARMVCVGLTFVLLAVVLRTGSRGALIAIAALVVVVFLKANPVRKFLILILCVVMALAFPVMVPKTVIARFSTILKTNTNDVGGFADRVSAVESTNARRELMLQALRLTRKHPLFGVGLGNFANQSAELSIAKGEVPMWFTCHNIFLLVLSETGIPGFLLYMAVIVVCYKSLFSLQRQARNVPELQEVGRIAFCIAVSLTAFLACGIFSTSAYTFPLPLLAGLTAALVRVSKPLLETVREKQAQPVAIGPTFFPGPPDLGCE